MRKKAEKRKIEQQKKSTGGAKAKVEYTTRYVAL